MLAKIIIISQTILLRCLLVYFNSYKTKKLDSDYYTYFRNMVASATEVTQGCTAM